MIKSTLYSVLVFLSINSLYAQTKTDDSLHFDYGKIYSYCLDGRINPVLDLINVNGKLISDKDKKFKNTFEKTFKYATDSSSYLSDRKSDIDPLLKIFHSYWRTSMLNNTKNYDSVLFKNLEAFFANEYPELKKAVWNDSLLCEYYEKYIHSKNYRCVGMGQTGGLFDLLVWKKTTDTVYSFNVAGEALTVKVFFMDDFITLGWSEFSTLGRHYPGGWAKKDGLYCVKKAYDLNSEDFKFSYLAHEGRHFADHILFPKLCTIDLEYRAKLAELSLCKTNLYKVLDFFIESALKDSENSHPAANYCVVRDLSRVLFKSEYVGNKEEWHKISAEAINNAAEKLLVKNTALLKSKGADVEKYIKLEK